MGAGTAIPTIRYTSEQLGQSSKATVIRINPREPHIGGRHISLPCGALQGLEGSRRFFRADKSYRSHMTYEQWGRRIPPPLLF